jgi:hypothetical protein
MLERFIPTGVFLFGAAAACVWSANAGTVGPTYGTALLFGVVAAQSWLRHGGDVGRGVAGGPIEVLLDDTTWSRSRGRRLVERYFALHARAATLFATLAAGVFTGGVTAQTFLGVPLVA